MRITNTMKLVNICGIERKGVSAGIFFLNELKDVKTANKILVLITDYTELKKNISRKFKLIKNCLLNENTSF